MVSVNLLPWRVQRYHYRKNIVMKSIIIYSILFILIYMVAYYSIDRKHQITSDKYQDIIGKKQIINEELLTLSHQLKKLEQQETNHQNNNKIYDKKQYITDLITVLSIHTPQKLWLTQLTINNGHWVLTGNSLDVLSINTLQTQLIKSKNKFENQLINLIYSQNNYLFQLERKNNDILFR